MAPTLKLPIVWILFCAYFCLSSTVAVAYDKKSQYQSFLSTKGSQFVVDAHTFYVNGFNAYYLMYVAVDEGSRSVISQLLQQAVSVGLTVCRTWAFNDGGYHALQVSPGQFDEKVFQALDFILHEAKSNGLRVILSLSNNYANMGGKAQYVQWGRDAGLSLSSDDDFFTNPTLKGYYKNFLQAVLTRINTLTGVAYKDDPTIFAWELMNEPRCPSDVSGDTLYYWIQEMAAYVKSIDSNHLVEAGLEGFYGPSTPDKLQFNPSAMQLVTGTDYIRFSQIPSIDFTSVHSYPDLWLPNASFAQQLVFLSSWVRSHISDGYATQKPVLFAEFGFSHNNAEYSEKNRYIFLSAMYSAIYSSATTNGPAAGALLWQICSQELVSTVANDGYGVILSQGSSTTTLIARQSQKLSALNQ